MHKNFVFVYGTLRKGFWNHSFLGNSRFLGYGKTKEKYSLYADSIPYVVKEPLTQIKGEIYEVDDETLQRLDELEGHPSFYKRELVDVITEDGKLIKAWIYFYPYKNGHLIQSGDYKDCRR
ncbi:MAG: gamma-glutamylcyclotransferase family protein [Persephonella sp.]|nr:gamma-glutamylcyclotransferase family protein [Persephonella sp.]